MSDLNGDEALDVLVGNTSHVLWYKSTSVPSPPTVDGETKAPNVDTGHHASGGSTRAVLSQVELVLMCAIALVRD